MTTRRACWSGKGDPMPNDHDARDMLPHDVADEVCGVCGYACACPGGVA